LFKNIYTINLIINLIIRSLIRPLIRPLIDFFIFNIKNNMTQQDNILSYFIRNKAEHKKCKYKQIISGATIAIYYLDEEIYTNTLCYSGLKIILNYETNIEKQIKNNKYENITTANKFIGNYLKIIFINKDADITSEHENYYDNIRYLYKTNKTHKTHKTQYLCKFNICFYIVETIKFKYNIFYSINSPYFYKYLKKQKSDMKYFESIVLIPNKYELNFYSKLIIIYIFVYI